MIQIYNIIATNMEFVTTFTGVVTDITHEDNYIDGIIPLMKRIGRLSTEIKIELTDKINANEFGFDSILSTEFNHDLSEILEKTISFVGASCYWEFGFLMIDLRWRTEERVYVNRNKIITYILQTLSDGWAEGIYNIGETVRYIIYSEYKQIFVPESVASDDIIYESREIRTDKRYYFNMYLASVNHTFMGKKYDYSRYNKKNYHRKQPPRDAGYYVAGYVTLGGDNKPWKVIGNNFSDYDFFFNNHRWISDV